MVAPAAQARMGVIGTTDVHTVISAISDAIHVSGQMHAKKPLAGPDISKTSKATIVYYMYDPVLHRLVAFESRNRH